MKNCLYPIRALRGLTLLAVSASPAHAAVSLTNGSFESIGTQYSAAIGGLNAATGWINLSATTDYQASSAQTSNPPNDEFSSTAGTATGSRYLRLASDETNVGVLAQNMGTMTVGETYMITADIFGGPGTVNYAATISLVNQVNATPTTTYSFQTVSGIANGSFTAGAFNFSYTATTLDDGNPLVLLVTAHGAPSGNYSRGGLDNLQLVMVPEPSAALLGTLGGLTLLRRRR